MVGPEGGSAFAQGRVSARKRTLPAGRGGAAYRWCATVEEVILRLVSIGWQGATVKWTIEACVPSANVLGVRPGIKAADIPAFVVIIERICWHESE